jgi:hypothetical protein
MRVFSREVFIGRLPSNTRYNMYSSWWTYQSYSHVRTFSTSMDSKCWTLSSRAPSFRLLRSIPLTPNRLYHSLVTGKVSSTCNASHFQFVTQQGRYLHWGSSCFSSMSVGKHRDSSLYLFTANSSTTFLAVSSNHLRCIISYVAK